MDLISTSNKLQILWQDDAVLILAEGRDQKYAEGILKVLHCYTIDDYACLEGTDSQKTIERQIYISVGTASSMNQIDDDDELPACWFNFRSTQYLCAIAEENEELLKKKIKKNEEVGGWMGPIVCNLLKSRLLHNYYFCIFRFSGTVCKGCRSPNQRRPAIRYHVNYRHRVKLKF